MEFYQGHARCHMTKFSLWKQLALSESLSQMLVCLWALSRQLLRTKGHSVKPSIGKSDTKALSLRGGAGPEGEATTL